jgi:hypothetical protein
MAKPWFKSVAKWATKEDRDTVLILLVAFFLCQFSVLVVLPWTPQEFLTEALNWKPFAAWAGLILYSAIVALISAIIGYLLSKGIDFLWGKTTRLNIYTLFRLRVGDDELGTWARALMPDLIAQDPYKLSPANVLYFTVEHIEDISDDVAGEAGDSYLLILRVWDFRLQDFVAKKVAGQFHPLLIEYLTTDTEEVHEEMHRSKGTFDKEKSVFFYPSGVSSQSILARMSVLTKKEPNTEDLIKALSEYEISR